MVDRIDLCERYSYLDAVCWVAEVGSQAMGQLAAARFPIRRWRPSNAY